MIQLVLFPKENQGRSRAAEPKECREEFERLRLELVNYLLQEIGVKMTLTSLDKVEQERMKQRLLNRGGRPAPLSFLAMELYLTLGQQYWPKFTCADFRQHIATVKEAVAKARQK